mgnify:CR=1 FL=1
MAEVFDFGELENDDNFKTKIIELNENVENAASVLNNFFSNTDYDSLSLEDKVRLVSFNYFVKENRYVKILCNFL